MFRRILEENSFIGPILKSKNIEDFKDKIFRRKKYDYEQTKLEGYRRYVNSSSDFHHHSVNHVKNVKALSRKMFAMIENLDDFSSFGFSEKEIAQMDVDLLRGLADDIGLNHDAAKVNNQTKFKKWSEEFCDVNGIDSLVKIRSSLYKHYGDDFKNISPERKSEALRIVKELNMIDNAWTDKLIDSYNVSPATKELLLKIEKVADLVERGKNPVTPEEMGKNDVYLGSSDRSLDKNLQKYAKILEAHYYDITDSLDLNKSVSNAKNNTHQDELKESALKLTEREEGLFGLASPLINSESPQNKNLKEDVLDKNRVLTPKKNRIGV